MTQVKDTESLWRLPSLGPIHRRRGDLDLALLFAVRAHGSGGCATLKEALGMLATYQQQLERARDGFRIVVGGRVKAGKSTLLTALLGGQFQFPSAATVCTSLPIRLVRGTEGNRLRITFKDGRIEYRTELTDLAPFATVQGAHSCEAIAIHLEWDHKGFPPDLEIIDTPGCQDPSQVRDHLASEEVRKADQLLYTVACSAGGTLQESDFQALREFRTAKAGKQDAPSILVVLTQADTLHSQSALRDLQEQARRSLVTGGFEGAEVVSCSALGALSALYFQERERGMDLPATVADPLPEDWLESPTASLRQLGCLRKSLALPEVTEPRPLHLWQAANLAPVLGFLAGGWERKLLAAEDVIRQRLWAVAKDGSLEPTVPPSAPSAPPSLRQINPVFVCECPFCKRPFDPGVSRCRNENCPFRGFPVQQLEALGIHFQSITPHEAHLGGPGQKLQPVKITRPYFMATTPVTQRQWKELINRPALPGGGTFPVTGVSREEIADFISALHDHFTPPRGWSYRLPSPLEWEAAAQAGSKGRWCFWPGSESLADYAWFGDQAGGVQRVAGKQKNAFGMYDMHGNVEEVTADGKRLFACGGSFGSNSLETRSGCRRPWDGRRDQLVGFRLVLDRG